jgi:hypothetical protein
MQYIYFPGNSPLNRNELEEFSKMIKSHGVDFYGHEYEHWKNEKLSFDEERELSTAMSNIDNNQDYVLLGKSIGTYMAVKFIEKIGKDPVYTILMGIPTGIGEDRLGAYKRVLSKVATPIHLIQNENDPFGKIEDVRKVLSGIELKELAMDADTHQYSYADEVEEILF